MKSNARFFFRSGWPHGFSGSMSLARRVFNFQPSVIRVLLLHHWSVYRLTSPALFSLSSLSNIYCIMFQHSCIPLQGPSRCKLFYRYMHFLCRADAQDYSLYVPHKGSTLVSPDYNLSKAGIPKVFTMSTKHRPVTILLLSAATWTYLGDFPSAEKYVIDLTISIQETGIRNTHPPKSMPRMILPATKVFLTNKT